MSSTDSPEGTYGDWAYVRGLKLTFLLLAVLIVIRLLGPAAVSLNLAAQGGEGLFGVLLFFWVVGLAVQLLLAAFMATFLYISGHFAGPVLTLSVTASESPYISPSAAEKTGAVAINPNLFLPSEFAGLFYLVPPALLLFAGYKERGRVDDFTAAVTNIVVGYGIMALLTIVPVAWLFNAVVAPAVTNMFSSDAVTSTIRVEYPRLIVSHVLVGLAYPLLFGSIGAMLRESASERDLSGSGSQRQQGHQRAQQPQSRQSDARYTHTHHTQQSYQQPGSQRQDTQEHRQRQSGPENRRGKK